MKRAYAASPREPTAPQSPQKKKDQLPVSCLRLSHRELIRPLAPCPSHAAAVRLLSCSSRAAVVRLRAAAAARLHDAGTQPMIAGGSTPVHAALLSVPPFARRLVPICKNSKQSAAGAAVMVCSRSSEPA